MSCIRTAFAENEEMAQADIVGAHYDIESGKVAFLKQCQSQEKEVILYA